MMPTGGRPPRSRRLASPPSSRRQLVVDDLDHLLARGEALQTSSPTARSRTRVDEILDHLEVDVGLEQRQAHLAQGLLDLASVSLPRP